MLDFQSAVGCSTLHETVNYQRPVACKNAIIAYKSGKLAARMAARESSPRTTSLLRVIRVRIMVKLGEMAGQVREKLG